MPRHEPLDNIRHKDLRIDRRPGPGRGFDVQLARVFPVELGALQAEYPLFLTRNAASGHFDLVALLGLEAGENLYLGEGEWLARIQPLSIERQPFLIGFQPDQDPGGAAPMPVIHIDMDHPAVSDSVGEPVFLPHGGDSPLLERMNTVLATIHAGHQASESFSRLLVGLDLVESLDLEVELNDGSRRGLTGLYTINEQRLAGLDGDSLATLHRQGCLQHVYMLLASMPQLAVLIERKNRKLGAPAPA
ncbi:MAG: SapC family protein [Wenzhouxiangella sp.]